MRQGGPNGMLGAVLLLLGALVGGAVGTEQEKSLAHVISTVCKGEPLPLAYVVGRTYETMLGAAVMHLPVAPNVPFLAETLLNRSYDMKGNIGDDRFPCAPRPLLACCGPWRDAHHLPCSPPLPPPILLSTSTPPLLRSLSLGPGAGALCPPCTTASTPWRRPGSSRSAPAPPPASPSPLPPWLTICFRTWRSAPSPSRRPPSAPFSTTPASLLSSWTRMKVCLMSFVRGAQGYLAHNKQGGWGQGYLAHKKQRGWAGE